MEIGENKIKEDCDKLYIVLKNCENPDEEKEEENLKLLHRIVFLITYRQGSKMMAITIATAGYLCHHPMLPVILVEILKDSKNMKVCSYVLEIMVKLILKNALIAENERKAIRKGFHDPYHFKTLLEAFHQVDVHFQHEKTNMLFYEIQVRLLKVINCLYSRKGQVQISLISDATVEFIVQHFVKYKSHKDISKTMLPLIKTLCRNKKHCIIICNEPFVNSLVAVVPAANKFPAAISILRFMSRSPEAVLEMSRSEKLFHFVISTAICHSEKSTYKKYLMATLYKLTRTYYGVQFISKNYLWLLLLEFFVKGADHLDELRQRLAFTKAYTILHRGVRNQYVAITPVNLNLNFSNEILDYIEETSNHHFDDSDNEESEDEDEHKNEQPNCINISEENDDENENDDEFEESDEHDDVRDEPDDDQDNQVQQKDDKKDLFNAGDYYIELKPESFHAAKSNLEMEIFNGINVDAANVHALVESRVNRHALVNRQALPDVVHAESDKNDTGCLTANINVFSAEEMARKMKNMKGFTKDDFCKKIVYDFDALIEEQHSNVNANVNVDIPDIEVLRSKLNRNGKASSSELPINKLHQAKRSPPTLAFESRFECGNLRKAEQIADYEYELFLSPDINMTNGLQWFYFQVSNMIAGKTYAFNIANFQRANSQFKYGLQPVMFSSASYILNATGWKKIGDKLMYFGNEYINKESAKQFRTLRFSVTFPHTNDYCYIAYHFPYTYTRLMTTMLPHLTAPEHIYSRVDKLTSTVNGFNEVPLVTITASTGTIPLEKRPIVFLTARVHPGESNASWIMDGVLQFLLGDDERANKARGCYIFKIIPMLNPEGVIYGNSRCGLTGNDLNRCWKKPHPVLHPEIYYAKKLVEFAKDKLPNGIRTFIDIHGHSRRKFFFLYGCNPKQSWNDNDKSSADSSDATFNLMAKALSFNEHMKMTFCRNTIERKREATCRVVMWREFGIKCSYTLECSYCSGENKKKINTQMLREIGNSIVIALADLADVPVVSLSDK